MPRSEIRLQRPLKAEWRNVNLVLEREVLMLHLLTSWLWSRLTYSLEQLALPKQFKGHMCRTGKEEIPGGGPCLFSSGGKEGKGFSAVFPSDTVCASKGYDENG